jgi:hypothetical protein
MVAFHGIPSYRNAGLQTGSHYLFFLLHVSHATKDGGVPWRPLLSERWSPDRQSLSFLPAARPPMPPGMVAFHGIPSYRNAGLQTGSHYLFFLPHVRRCHQGWWRSMASSLIGTLVSRPAVIIFSSCCTSPDATKDGGVPWRPFLSERWHPAGSSLKGAPDSSLALMLN